MTKIIFDVGSFDGESTVEILKKIGTDDFRAYLFEPHPNLADVLRNKFSNEPRVTIVEKAVCDYTGESQFNLAAGPDWHQGYQRIGGACSLLDFRPKLDIISAWGSDASIGKDWRGQNHMLRRDLFYSGKSISVQTIRLDSFIEENKIKNIDFLHIDAQGCDLEVLMSLGKYHSIVEEGACECAFDKNSAIYSNQKYFLDDTKKWLEENDFEITSISPNVPYAADRKNPNEWNVNFRKK